MLHNTAVSRLVCSQGFVYLIVAPALSVAILVT